MFSDRLSYTRRSKGRKCKSLEQQRTRVSKVAMIIKALSPGELRIRAISNTLSLMKKWKMALTTEVRRVLG
jgi:hypothetical protein